MEEKRVVAGAGQVQGESEGWERRSQAKTSPCQGGEENILGPEWVGQPDPGVGLKGRLGVGLEGSSGLSHPAPTLPELPGASALPGGRPGAALLTLGRRLSLGFPLPSCSNL